MVQTRGFSLIEIMVVILIIGIVTAIGLPRFLRSPVPVTQNFIHKLNTLVTEAAEQAQEKGEVRRVFFNFGSRTVEMQTGQGKPIAGAISIPQEIEVSDVVINGVSQFQVGAGRRPTFYFLINSDGVSQEVMLILADQTRPGPRTYEFYLNPFTSLFRVH